MLRFLTFGEDHVRFAIVILDRFVSFTLAATGVKLETID